MPKPLPESMPRGAHATRQLSDLVYATANLAERALALPQARSRPAVLGAWLDDIVRTLVDPDPDASLQDSLRHRVRLFSGNLLGNPMSALAKWREIEGRSSFWPREVRRAAATLGVGTGRLPDWKRIARFFERVGFEAVPVLGKVNLPIYAHLTARGRVPVSTRWAARYRRAPYYWLPVDTLHDLAHGLCFAMDDFRKLSVEFARATLRTGPYANGLEPSEEYVRLFEFAYVRSPSGGIEPIGTGPMLFETLRVSRGRLVPILRDADALSRQKKAHQPYPSREAWREDVRCAIRDLRRRAVAARKPT